MTKITVKVVAHSLIAAALGVAGFTLPARQASAIPLTNCGKRPFSEISSLVDKIAVFGNDERKTLRDFAKETGASFDTVEKTFSATGLLTCDNRRQTTAQLTGNNSVVTTAAHTFFDKHCNPINYKSCLFSVYKKTRFEHYNVKLKSLRIGGCKHKNAENDWAVLELEKPVTSSVRPYRLPSKHQRLSVGDKLIHISAFAENFKVANEHPRFVVECQVRDLRKYDGYPVQTDCDSGVGSSGSAQLLDTPSGLTMVSMHVANTADEDGGQYDPATAFNISIPVAGAFYDALTDSIAATGGPRLDTAKAK